MVKQKARKSLFRKVSSDNESKVELIVLESDTCTEDIDHEIIEVDFVVVKLKKNLEKYDISHEWILLTEISLKVVFSKQCLKL